jgi:hypothetical protein
MSCCEVLVYHSVIGPVYLPSNNICFYIRFVSNRLTQAVAFLTYSEGARFESRPGCRLFSLRLLVVVRSPSRRRTGEYFGRGRDRFLSHPSQFINHSAIRCIVVRVIDIVKLTANNIIYVCMSSVVHDGRFIFVTLYFSVMLCIDIYSGFSRHNICINWRYLYSFYITTCFGRCFRPSSGSIYTVTLSFSAVPPSIGQCLYLGEGHMYCVGFHAGFLLSLFFSTQMEAICSSETSVDT